MTAQPSAAHRRALATELLRELYALAGGATMRVDRRTGNVTMDPPGSCRHTRGELRETLPPALVAACELIESSGVDKLETAGLRQFAQMLGGTDDAKE